jgi:3,4-dihydroxy 2-butanone 4-phosphate synthase/GTP cyclohydrolase II
MRKTCLREGDLDRIREAVGRVSRAVDDILAGRVVVIADEAARAGCLAFAGSRATADSVAWTLHHGSGPLRAAMLPERARALAIPPTTATPDGLRRPHCPVSVDAASGISTGGSARDLARTIALLAHPASGAGDFTRPGHIVTQYAAPGGVLARPRPAEAVMDLLSIAALSSVGALCALVGDGPASAPAGEDEMRAFCTANGTALIGIQDLIAFRELTEPLATRSQSQPNGSGNTEI